MIEQRAGVLVMTIDRPGARNALSPAGIDELVRAYDTLEADDSLRVGVLTGAGDHFCAGMDLKLFAAGAFTPETADAFTRLVETPPPKPLIAAVEGAAVAGGWELALACDLVIASTEAHFAMPEVRRGIVPTGGALLRLPRRMPYQMALELLLTGDALTAEDAHRHGVVNTLCEPGRALDVALELAEEVAAGAPLAIDGILRIVREQLAPELWRRQRELGRATHASDDAREGAIAFAEKRPAVWRGR